MKSAGQVNLPGDLTYTKEHVWIRPDGDLLIAGISDYAQDQLGEVAYVDLPEPGQRFAANDSFGSIESVKSVNSLYMPVAGEIAAINETLADAPEEVNASCYDQGWLVKIRPDDPAEAQKLLSAESYRATLD